MVNKVKKATRRDFLKTSAVTGGAVLAANMAMLSNVHADGNDVIRVGLVGCGGRGKGAAAQNLKAGPNIRLVAMGDAFQDRIDDALTTLRRDRAIAQNIDVPAERQFVGLDAFERVIASCDLVILATPPGFRATHLRAAVAARKNIFTEKPVCVDGPGARMCLQAYEDANTNRLSIVAGLQRHYQTGYLESMRRIHGGELGAITSARCYWNQGALWHRAREQGMTDVQWQIRNWLYFTWLSGDHICEQHVHNLDVINWAIQAHPVKCQGMGGRQVRTGPEFGHIFDHFAIEYEYPSGARLTSMCRQIPGTLGNVSEAIVGTQAAWGSPSPSQPRYAITGYKRNWTFGRAQDNEPYQQEHVALIRAIRNNQPINDLKYVTESSLTAVMGRMAAYTGREVTWEQAKDSEENLMPANLRFDMNLPVPPVAVPGRA